MNITKLPSGSYRIRQTENGKTYSITVPYKPTKTEAYDLISAKVKKPPTKYDRLTFEKAFKTFVEDKEYVLSPSTIRGYEYTYRVIPDDFRQTELKDIDTLTLKRVINNYAKDHSPKSTRNLNGLIQAVIHHFMEDAVFKVTLPQKEVKEVYIPSEEDVKKLMQYVKGKKYEVPLALASLSLRASEIMAINPETDLTDDNMLIINKGKVKDKNGVWVIKKNPKNSKSNRVIPIGQELADTIRQNGIVYDGAGDSLDHYLEYTCKKIGIQYFSVHKLRHFFCSYAHEKGYSDEHILAFGGWVSDSVAMRQIYRHELNKNQASQMLSTDITGLFS